MNEKTETPEPLAAVLAEMRHRAENHRQDGWESVAEELEEFCDRIDAAAAREYAQWHGETNAAKEERNRIACKMRYEFAAKCRACKSAPGNAAAMRGALDKAECVLLVAARFATDNAFTDADARENLRDVDWDGALTEIDAALAAPARNCDVGTAEEQAERFKQFCLDNHSAEHLCSRCPLGKRLGNDVDMCQLHWAQMPFDPAEGGAK